MKKNIGKADRIVRLAIAAIIALLYFTGTISGTLGTVLLVLAVIMLLTGLLRFCPLYLPCHFSSCKSE